MVQAIVLAVGVAAAQLLWQLALLIAKCRVIKKWLHEERPSFPWKKYALGAMSLTIAMLVDIIVNPRDIRSSLMISCFLFVVFAVGTFYQLVRFCSQRRLGNLASCVICIVLASNCALWMVFAKVSVEHI